MCRLMSEANESFVVMREASGSMSRSTARSMSRAHASPSAFMRNVLFHDLRPRLTWTRQAPLRLSIEATCHTPQNYSNRVTLGSHSKRKHPETGGTMREHCDTVTRSNALMFHYFR